MALRILNQQLQHLKPLKDQPKAGDLDLDVHGNPKTKFP